MSISDSLIDIDFLKDTTYDASEFSSLTEIKKSKKNNIFTKCFDEISSNDKKRIEQVDLDPKIDEVRHSCVCSQDNYYDVSGENHGLALTITDYDKPLTMRSSAIKDNSNLKFALEKRGFEMSLVSGRVTPHDFKQKLSNTLQKIDSKKITSFLLSISCHGEDDELLFSDKSRYEPYCKFFYQYILEKNCSNCYFRF